MAHCKSRTQRHRGEPRPKVGIEMRIMRRVSAAPRGHALMLPKSASGDAARQASPDGAESAPETNVQQWGAGRQRAADAQSPSVRVHMPWIPGVVLNDAVPPASALHIQRASRRFRRSTSHRSTSSCASPVGSYKSTITHHASTRNQRRSNRTLQFYDQLSKQMTWKPTLDELITLCTMVMMPVIFMGFSYNLNPKP
jgi:hypothetical protein